MNGFQNRKGQDLQKPLPGCMGKMINIFDLSTGMPRTKLLTEKPHQDGNFSLEFCAFSAFLHHILCL